MGFKLGSLALNLMVSTTPMMKPTHVDQSTDPTFSLQSRSNLSPTLKSPHDADDTSISAAASGRNPTLGTLRKKPDLRYPFDSGGTHLILVGLKRQVVTTRIAARNFICTSDVGAQMLVTGTTVQLFCRP